ncbi:membrane-spanning 4-domains subfamily A member 4D-like [Anneissia japonica]|uniref:membrane-spanning 4-domains subfamily A member 4D-like n=1 Tax=Anneissia japonica TaxID=1529436 RepID=UPI00142594CD|nr:membrane-spanning 4-domains subfamily A member 4D-like [Anneissia japonica]
MTEIPAQAFPVEVIRYQVEPPPSSLNSKGALITGFMQIALAVVSFIFGVTCVALGFCTGYASVPIWGSLLFYVVAGILGVVAGASKGENKCAIVGCLVMSILSAIIAFMHVVCGSFYTSIVYWVELKPMKALSILNVLIGVLEFIVAIVASAIMCRGSCCRQEPEPVYITEQPGSREMGQIQ